MAYCEVRQANPKVEKGTAVKKGSITKRTEKIIEIINDAGEKGATIEFVVAAMNDGSDNKKVRTAMAKIASKGLVFTSEGKSRRTYFATQEWAAACQKAKKRKYREWNCMSTITMRNACHDAVKFAGAGGVLTRHIAEKLGKHLKTAQKAMNWLRSRGDVFLCVNAKPPRYFLNEEQAQAYMAQQKKPAKTYSAKRPKCDKPKEPKPPKEPKQPKQKAQKAYKPNQLVLKTEDQKSIKAPVIKWENQEAIIPEGVKITVRNAPPGRFEATGQDSYFSALAIGSYKPSDSAIARAYG